MSSPSCRCKTIWFCALHKTATEDVLFVSERLRDHAIDKSYCLCMGKAATLLKSLAAERDALQVQVDSLRWEP